jgi:hypothetical protein
LRKREKRKREKRKEKREKRKEKREKRFTTGVCRAQRSEKRD